MDFCTHALVSGKARTAARTLLARADHMWMWPGIPLTAKRGAACVPVAADAARFWITRLHGPEANYSNALPCLDAAAQKLSEGDEAGAQQALDASGLNRLSSDGAVLARAVADSLGIAPLDLPWVEGPRLGRAEVIAAHLPLFKDFAPAVELLAKAGGWDESKHPRVPAGSREGGQFQSGGGSNGRSPAAPGIGHVGGPPPGRAPEIAEEDPGTEPLRNAVAKISARWLARALANAEFGAAGEYLTALEAAAEGALWLYDKYPSIKAYLDGPKSLEELQRYVGKPRNGYDVHHIVEQTAADRDDHSWDDINGPDNLVSIPRLKHWEITGWYMRGNERYGGLSPRQYLRGKDWDERRRVGLDVLIRFGVLKP
ncbi:MAG: hypothetical protein ACREDV_01145 [Methylocella sp.]